MTIIFIRDHSKDYETLFGNYKTYFIPILNKRSLKVNLSYEYDAVIITSQTAVHSLEIKNQDSFSEIFVVGKKTSELIKSKFPGLKVLGECDDAKSLAKFIIEYYKDKNIKLLFLCGRERRDELPKILRSEGIKLREVVCYETVYNEKFKENFENIYKVKEKEVKESKADVWVMFFSPSGVKYFFEKVEIKEFRFGCIGNTTANELKLCLEKYCVGYDKEIVVAKSPTAEGLYDSFITCVNSEK